MVEGARLESVYTPKGYRGFESLPLCKKKQSVMLNYGLFLYLKIVLVFLLRFGTRYKFRRRVSLTAEYYYNDNVSNTEEICGHL